MTAGPKPMDHDERNPIENLSDNKIEYADRKEYSGLEIAERLTEEYSMNHPVGIYLFIHSFIHLFIFVFSFSISLSLSYTLTHTLTHTHTLSVSFSLSHTHAHSLCLFLSLSLSLYLSHTGYQCWRQCI